MSADNLLNKYHWTFAGQLFIPYVQPYQKEEGIISRTLRETTAAGITHEEIFGTIISLEELINLVREIPYIDWLLFLSKISTALLREDKYDTKLQLHMSNMVFSDETLHTIITSIKEEENHIPFNIWQVCALAKIVLLESYNDVEDIIDPNRKKHVLSKSLLGINDYLSFEDFESRTSKSIDETKRISLIESLLRLYTFQFVEFPKHLIPRYHEIFFNIPLSPEALSLPNHMNLKDEFQSLMHFPLDLFYVLIFGLYANYLIAWKDNKPPDNDKVIINRDIFFSKTKIPQKESDKFLDFISVSQNDYQIHYKKTYGDSMGKLNDFNILRQRPLIALNNSQFVSINSQWLYERIGEGVFWDINDALEDSNNFRTFFGELYHLYFSNIFKRMFPSSFLQERVFFNIPYDGNNSSDAIVYYPGKLLLFEAKWPTLRMNQTMIPGNIESFNEDIDNIIVHSAKQLERNIKDLLNGTLKLTGIDPSDIETFYPIIVTARPMPIGPLLTNYILERVNDHGFLATTSKVKRLEIISIGELEYLEPLVISGKTIHDIIDSKQNSEYYEHPLIWYLSKSEDKGLPINEYLSTLFEKQTTQYQNVLF